MRALFISLLAMYSMTIFAQEEEKDDTISFNPKNFNMIVETMQPRSYISRTLTSEYHVTVRNDSVFCYLPYIGRVYQPSFDNDGLTFDKPVKDFKVKSMSKGRQRIRFRVTKGAVNYEFDITYWKDGSAYLNLQPSNAQGISYDGRMEETK